MEALIQTFRNAGVEPQYPAIFVGGAYLSFKKNTLLPIKRATKRVELEDIISQYSGVDYTENPLIIEDITYLRNVDEQQCLLKFLEETKLHVVLLSRQDIFLPTILSRTQVFIKTPMTKTSSDFMAPSRGREKIEQTLSPDAHPYEYERYQGKFSPLIYFDEATIPTRPNRAKLIKLMED